MDVVLPPQWCCGLPALGNGNLKLARFFAEKNAASLSNYIDAGYDIIYTCTSCGLCLLHDYPGILEIPQGKKIAENSYDVHEYIVKLINEGYTKPDFGEVRRKVAYHIPCHLRALEIGYPAAKLMSLIPGLEYEILDDACCGLSGSYGFKKSMKSTAVQIGKQSRIADQENRRGNHRCRLRLLPYAVGRPQWHYHSRSGGNTLRITGNYRSKIIQI